MSQDHIIVKVVQHSWKNPLYYTFEDDFKNQDEKLAHFKPCKQDTIQLVTSIQKWGFFWSL